jgi:hypothetical protein
MDIKEFKKQVKKECHFMAPPSQRKECMKTMMCNWDHCQKEQQNLTSTALTDADRESCKNKDFSKAFVCEQKLIEKKALGLMDKQAALNHCTANKCPQARNLIRKSVSEFAKSMHFKKNSILAQREECMKQHCSKEIQEKDKQSDLFYKGMDECDKKFATFKEQTKCNSKTSKQSTKASLKVNDCRKKHCDIQPGNKKNATKSDKKNNNKKTKKN